MYVQYPPKVPLPFWEGTCMCSFEYAQYTLNVSSPMAWLWLLAIPVAMAMESVLVISLQVTVPLTGNLTNEYE